MHKTRHKILTYIIAAAIIAVTGALCADAAKPKRNQQGVRRDKQRTEKQIRLTQEQLRENKIKTRSNLNKLNALNADVEKQKQLIAAMNDSLLRTQQEIARTSDSITALERDADIIRRSYANALRTARKRRRGADDLAFIFSAGSFTQSLSRYRYLQTFSRWLGNKAVVLRASIDTLQTKKERLESLKASRAAALGRLNEAKDMLLSQQSATKVIVDQLQADKKSLNAYLKEQQQQMRRLDEELDRLIAEELEQARREQERKEAEERARQAEQQRKEAEQRRLAQQNQDKKNGKNKKSSKKDKQPAAQQQPATVQPVTPPPAPKTSIDRPDQRLSAVFAENRGRLPWPVDGSHTIVKPFGVTHHPSLPDVLVENSGIDMAVAAGASARAVHDGVVSVIFKPSGYRTVVVVRHGDYLTVYGNLDNVQVAKGDNIKRGQTLGRIYADPSDGGHAILHFEVRKGREKLNPQLWLR